MHPNPLGQVAIANAVRDWLPAGGTAGTIPGRKAPEPCSYVPILGSFLWAPEDTINVVFGDLAMNATVSGCALLQSTFVPNQSVHVLGSGFAPLATVSGNVKASFGAYSDDLGTFTTDVNGVLDQQVSLPANLPSSGAALLQMTGPALSGDTVVLRRQFTVMPSSDSDLDLDGLPDLCDNCPGHSNVGQEDADNDGLGDACDLCGADPDNDLDGDGLCAATDPCPLDPLNDSDGDGQCAEVDFCPGVAVASCFFSGDFESSNVCEWSASIGSGDVCP